MSDLSQAMNSEQFSEAAIFGRVIERSGELSVELAEHVLSLNISSSDQQKVQLLLEKNANSTLSTTEREELENLKHVADLISLWHSRARRALNAS